MKRIFLVGYMGSGKTTLGMILAQEKGWTFIDLDWYVEERFHKSVQQLFREKGEDGFRELERQMLHEVGDFEDVVISAGGGTPCFFDNMEYMNSRGETVFLQAKPETLFERLRTAKTKRPLLVMKKTDEELRDFIVSGLNKREIFYAKAKHRFSSDELESHEQIVASARKLAELLNI